MCSLLDINVTIPFCCLECMEIILEGVPIGMITILNRVLTLSSKENDMNSHSNMLGPNILNHSLCGIQI
ncbi:hypothetical protein A4A49_55740 [Nicotiana attenuata]|uniref:Uncharacterized protein n=1 Tax=Nicotiana attenuata TaxID=49451 RepID=A0A314KQ41_NICAT|nr:hypothetical protein A4A49_55740 [Nicotiana attenuata]